MFNLDAITNENNKGDKKMAIQNANNWTIWIRQN